MRCNELGIKRENLGFYFFAANRSARFILQMLMLSLPTGG
jgi:hypothetical protein